MHGPEGKSVNGVIVENQKVKVNYHLSMILAIPFLLVVLICSNTGE